jgi:hypothetical protein
MILSYCTEQCEENFYDAEYTAAGKMFYPLQGMETGTKTPIKVCEVRLHFEKGSRLRGIKKDMGRLIQDQRKVEIPEQ